MLQPDGGLMCQVCARAIQLHCEKLFRVEKYHTVATSSIDAVLDSLANAIFD